MRPTRPPPSGNPRFPRNPRISPHADESPVKMEKQTGAMGTLSGHVDVVGLSTLFQMIAEAGREGYLSVSSSDRSTTLEFGPAGLRLISGARRANPLGQILLRTGKLTEQQLKGLLKKQKRTRIPLGRLVCDRGFLTPEEVDGALRNQVEEEIYELFEWTGATFEFKTLDAAAPPPADGPLASVLLDSDVVSFLIEGARRVDELRRVQSVIPDQRLFADPVEIPTFLQPKTDRLAVVDVMSLADGSRTVRQILDESIFPRFTVLRTLRDMAVNGILKIRDRQADGAPRTVVMRKKDRASGGGSTEGQRVYVLGTDPTRTAAHAFVLRTAGYETFEGTSFDEMRERMKDAPPDLVVAEATFGTPEAAALFSLLKEDWNVPFVVLTDPPSKKEIEAALDSGASSALLKPLDDGRLLERINEILAESETRAIPAPRS